MRWSSVLASELKKGQTIEWEGAVCVVKSVTHNFKGRGTASVQAELQDVSSGAKKNVRLRSSDKITKGMIKKREFDVLYVEDGSVYCMDPETYDNFPLSMANLSENEQNLVQSMEVPFLWILGV